MIVETKDCIYETSLNLIQIEMTGFCNMNCKHCRAKNEPKYFFSENNFRKVLDLIQKTKGDDFKLTFSGGEPFLHKELLNYIKMANDRNVESIVITTNGSLINDSDLDFLNSLKIKNFLLQVSIDNLDSKIHDAFRGYKGAFKKCENLLEKIKEYPNINSSIRMTITEETMTQMEEMVLFAINKNCKIIGFGSIIPFGKAEDCKSSLDSSKKYLFLNEIVRLNLKYSNIIEVVTEDPLKSFIENSPWEITPDDCEKGLFGGCTAGIDSINIQSNGNVTPCSMIKESILNLEECKNSDEVIKKYQNSKLVKDLFERKYTGKCGKCKNRYICGGCRASAKGRTGNLFGSDESCWI